MPRNEQSPDNDTYRIHLSVTSSFFPKNNFGEVFLPETIKANLDDERIDGGIELKLEVSDAARITDLHLRSNTGVMTAFLLKYLNVQLEATVLDAINTVALNVKKSETDVRTTIITPCITELSEKTLKRIVGTASRSSKNRARLKKVAEVYKNALRNDENTGETVATAFLVSKKYARQLISEARKAGLIAPATTTRPRKGSNGND